MGLFLLCVCCSACTKLRINEAARPAEYQIVEEEQLPEEIRRQIELRKKEPFQITFEDEEALYIGQGYGTKEMEGYKIEVDSCEESEHFIYVHMLLYGPRTAGEKKESWPYRVIQLEKKGKQVIFLNELGGK